MGSRRGCLTADSPPSSLRKKGVCGPAAAPTTLRCSSEPVPLPPSTPALKGLTLLKSLRPPPPPLTPAAAPPRTPRPGRAPRPEPRLPAGATDMPQRMALLLLVPRGAGVAAAKGLPQGLLPPPLPTEPPATKPPPSDAESSSSSSTMRKGAAESDVGGGRKGGGGGDTLAAEERAVVDTHVVGGRGTDMGWEAGG